MSTQWLRSLAEEAGADDVGFVSVDLPELEVDREHARTALPGARTYIAFCVRMNRDNVRSPLRSITNTEFHFLDDREAFLSDVVKPLQDKVEPVYVVPGSNAETRVRKRFPHKTVRPVPNGL